MPCFHHEGDAALVYRNVTFVCSNSDVVQGREHHIAYIEIEEAAAGSPAGRHSLILKGRYRFGTKFARLRNAGAYATAGCFRVLGETGGASVGRSINT